MKKKKNIQFLSKRILGHRKESPVPGSGEGQLDLDTDKEITDFISTLKSKDLSIPTGKNFEDFYQKVEFAEKTTLKPQYFRNTRREVLRVAVVLLPFIILASLTFFYFQGKKETSYEVLSTLKGSKTKIILEDGTKIWLNSESELRYPSTFKGAGKRTVKLIGEAYFDVAKNEKKPFEVLAAGYKFKVLGTAFNIKAYPGEDKMQTTLEHGKVSVEKIISESDNESRKIISLKPKQTIVIYNDNIIDENQNKLHDKLDSLETLCAEELKEVQNNKPTLLMDDDDLSPYLSWKDNKLVFRDVTVGEMVNDLERWYNINVVIADAKIKDIKFTAIFTTETTEQAIKAISMAANVNYEINNNLVILKTN